MSELSEALTPALVWGLFARGLGLVFLISFLSLARQIVPGAGRDGGLPIARRLAKIKQDFSSWRRIYYFPTLLWLSDSDAMLRVLTWGGALAACLVIYGGPFSFWALFACYVCYVSLDMAAGLIFPWDCLLFESALLALLLPETRALPDWHAVSAPAPIVAWAFRLLLFRVMFGFGKQKFMGSTAKDLAYLKGFLIAQPLPSPLGWYAQKLPAALLRPAVLMMFAVEVPMPFCAFVPGTLSLICAAGTTLLMIGIQAMGSFGYFSLLTIVDCIPLLDNLTPRLLHVTALWSAGAPIFINTFVLAHTLCACMAFPFNSWVGQNWHLWAFWFRLPRALQLPFDFVRFMHPFRWLHPYGVFPPSTSPGVKISLLVEVTWDEESWHEAEFEYSPSNEKSAPKFVAPHHPRGDQAVIYETFGLNPTSLINSMIGPWDPYAYGSQPAANTLVQRIVEGYGGQFLPGTVLAQHAEPPLAARLCTVMLEPVSLAQHRATGAWWKRSYVGPHTPPRGHDPRFWQDFLPEPEMWHFDAIFWRRRSNLHALMQRSLAGREDPMQLAIAGTDELSATDVERFWSELLPLLRSEACADLDSLADVVARVRERFDPRQLRALQRLLGRFSALLVARLEPLYLDRGGRPLIAAKTYFHLWMVTQQILCKGRNAYLAAMAEPTSVAAELAILTPDSGLYFQSIFRYQSMIFESQKLRLLTCFTPPYDEDKKRAMNDGTATLTPFERTVADLAEGVSGFFNVMLRLKHTFIGPRFDRGFPEMYPSFVQLESGEVVLRARAEPPAGRQVPLPPTPSVAAE